jgi:hypothetical protein
MAAKVAPVKAVATPRTNTVVTKAETLMPRNVTSEPAMVKREVTIESPAKGNLLERLGRRMRERQLARADRRAGSTSSLPVAPPTVAPKADETQKLSTVARGMLDKYMSKKYMGGGKMKKYMGGGMMEKYGMGGKLKKYSKGEKIDKYDMGGDMGPDKQGIKMLAKLYPTPNKEKLAKDMIDRLKAKKK